MYLQIEMSNHCSVHALLEHSEEQLCSLGAQIGHGKKNQDDFA